MAQYKKEVRLMGNIMERRKRPRYSLELSSRLHFSGNGRSEEVISLMTGNISSIGAYFRTNSPLPVDTEVSIDFSLQMDSFRQGSVREAFMKASGYVIRADARGMAVVFDKTFEIKPI